MHCYKIAKKHKKSRQALKNVSLLYKENLIRYGITNIFKKGETFADFIRLISVKGNYLSHSKKNARFLNFFKIFAKKFVVFSKNCHI